MKPTDVPGRTLRTVDNDLKLHRKVLLHGIERDHSGIQKRAMDKIDELLDERLRLMAFISATQLPAATADGSKDGHGSVTERVA